SRPCRRRDVKVDSRADDRALRGRRGLALPRRTRRSPAPVEVHGPITGPITWSVDASAPLRRCPSLTGGAADSDYGTWRLVFQNALAQSSHSTTSASHGWARHPARA